MSVEQCLDKEHRLSPAAWRRLTKSRAPLGTFDETAFQLQLTLQSGAAAAAAAGGGGGGEGEGPSREQHEQQEKLACSDPLTVPLFDGLGYHCVPHCGVYAQDDYVPAIPFVFLTLPFELLLRCISSKSRCLPGRLCEALSLHQDCFSFPPEASTSFHLMVHPAPQMKECQHLLCCSTRELNVITHTWTFPGVRFTHELEVETVVDMGVFGASGVEETHLDMQDSRFNGLPINRLEQRMVIIHWQSFSPLNAQVKLTENMPWHSFFLLTRHWASSRQCLSYHVILESDQVCRRVHEAVARMSTLGELLDYFQSGDAAGQEGQDAAKDVDQWNYDPFWVFAQIVEASLESK